MQKGAGLSFFPEKPALKMRYEGEDRQHRESLFSISFRQQREKKRWQRKAPVGGLKAAPRTPAKPSGSAAMPPVSILPASTTAAADKSRCSVIRSSSLPQTSVSGNSVPEPIRSTARQFPGDVAAPWTRGGSGGRYWFAPPERLFFLTPARHVLSFRQDEKKERGSHK